MKERRNKKSRAARSAGRRSFTRQHGGAVRRQEKSKSAERGWYRKSRDRHGEHYLGYFRAEGRRFEGKATVTPSDFKIYVRNIPSGIAYHTHRACFMARKGGWFEVHHENTKATLDSAIFEIERILTEALTNTTTRSVRPPASPPPKPTGLLALLKKALNL